MSDPGALTAAASSSSSQYSHGLPPRSRTPPPLRAVAMPLDPQVLNPDTDFSLDLVKVQFKCTYATSFGQELRVVGGAPELGAWDLAQVREGAGQQQQLLHKFSFVLPTAAEAKESTCRFKLRGCAVLTHLHTAPSLSLNHSLASCHHLKNAPTHRRPS